MSRGPYTPSPQELVLLLKEQRIRAGLTQEQVAEALDTSQATVARWERGEVDVSVSNLLKLAALFGVPPGALIRDGDGLDTAEREMIQHLRGHPRDRRVIYNTLKVLQETEQGGSD